MLAGRNILVVEDELLIAFDLEDTLAETGAITSLVHDVGHALAAISQADFSAAVVDCNLNNQSVEPVLEALVKKNIPFVLHSGSPAMDKFSRWPARGVISKPSTPEQIKHALTSAIRP